MQANAFDSSIKLLTPLDHMWPSIILPKIMLPKVMLPTVMLPMGLQFNWRLCRDSVTSLPVALSPGPNIHPMYKEHFAGVTVKWPLLYSLLPSNMYHKLCVHCAVHHPQQGVDDTRHSIP